MDDAVRVRGVEGVGDLDAEVEHLCERQRPLRDQALERLSFEHFEDQELLVLGFLVLVERADVGMVEGGDGARLDEGAGPIRLTGVWRQPLEHDRPAEDEILGEIDESRCALAELHHDPIVRQRSAGNVHALDHPFLLSAVFCHASSTAAPLRAASCRGDDGAYRDGAGRAGLHASARPDGRAASVATTGGCRYGRMTVPSLRRVVPHE